MSCSRISATPPSTRPAIVRSRQPVSAARRRPALHIVTTQGMHATHTATLDLPTHVRCAQKSITTRRVGGGVVRSLSLRQIPIPPSVARNATHRQRDLLRSTPRSTRTNHATALHQQCSVRASALRRWLSRCTSHFRLERAHLPMAATRTGVKESVSHRVSESSSQRQHRRCCCSREWSRCTSPSLSLPAPDTAAALGAAQTGRSPIVSPAVLLPVVPDTRLTCAATISTAVCVK